MLVQLAGIIEYPASHLPSGACSPSLSSMKGKGTPMPIRKGEGAMGRAAETREPRRGAWELELSEFDLPSAIDNALILVRERASRRGITLGHSVDDRLGQIRGDERKVKQVLLNLLSNALKFTPEGGRIDVRAAPQDGVAEISVADTGVGIAPEDQDAVFEEFRQVGTADKKVEGTGLGLALSRKFIEPHGGRIWVESEVGKGSTFRFTLPST